MLNRHYHGVSMLPTQACPEGPMLICWGNSAMGISLVPDEGSGQVRPTKLDQEV